ncbi:unnamed protein product [Ceratitis capitata]|uniref:(Mediterranean fruit fly) hypothetical protein n=1 Tax=Ceratitis capitata TaxID=7213 RepID=A0A811UF78_CERCA|nr:unnamed protein product [Ceratitis capitata]
MTEFGLRKKVRAHLTHSDNYWSVMTKYLSYSKLKRIMDYVLRFVFKARSNTLHNAEKRWDPASSIEIAEAELRLMKYTQHFFFANGAKRPIPLRMVFFELLVVLRKEKNPLRPTFVPSFACALVQCILGDLSASAFLNAFKRFIDRRGYSMEMFSDNGTNFVGAEKELRTKYEQCMADGRLEAFFANSDII